MLWSATMLSSDYSVFLQLVFSVPGFIGGLLVFYCVGMQSITQADFDNQIAIYINIDAEFRFVFLEWQFYISIIIAVRKDRKLLLLQHLEGM